MQNVMFVLQKTDKKFHRYDIVKDFPKTESRYRGFTINNHTSWQVVNIL